MNRSRQSLGRWGENLAAVYLASRAYIIVEKNARTPYGEIDLVTRQGEVTVFIEVKTRRNCAYGHPETAITLKKKDHLMNSALAYLQDHPELDGDWRIDILSILQQSSQDEPEITHFENAIS